MHQPSALMFEWAFAGSSEVQHQLLKALTPQLQHDQASSLWHVGSWRFLVVLPDANQKIFTCVVVRIGLHTSDSLMSPILASEVLACQRKPVQIWCPTRLLTLDPLMGCPGP